ncbi:hypothetical protein GDO81_026282, partial [Engystomops pustulosus]
MSTLRHQTPIHLTLPLGFLTWTRRRQSSHQRRGNIVYWDYRWSTAQRGEPLHRVDLPRATMDTMRYYGTYSFILCRAPCTLPRNNLICSTSCYNRKYSASGYKIPTLLILRGRS